MSHQSAAPSYPFTQTVELAPLEAALHLCDQNKSDASEFKTMVKFRKHVTHPVNPSEKSDMNRGGAHERGRGYFRQLWK